LGIVIFDGAERSGGRLTVLLGVKDLIAVDTEDALLIAHRSRAQKVRRVIDGPNQRGLTRYLCAVG